MKNKITILTILLWSISSVTAGDFRLKSRDTINVGSDLNAICSKSAAPKKLAEFNYRKMKHAVYLLSNLGADEENVEFVKIAQKLHDAEPDTALILIDESSGLKCYLAFMKRVERLDGGAPEKEFLKAWAEEHILGSVGAEGENQSRQWYLMLGYTHEKIAELK